MLRPHALLRAALDSIRSAESKIGKIAIALTSEVAPDSTWTWIQDRGERALIGMRANAGLIRDHMKPVALIVESARDTPDFLDSISNCGAAWSADAMLPYFYQDWSGTEAFKKVRTLIVTALRRHRPAPDRIAVLGAGACGIVDAVAEDFDAVYGIDLSVPTLLLAQSVLDGRPTAFHLKHAEWKAVQLQSCQPPHRKNVRLAVADVANLPFSDNSLSAVVTQYLMDIVGNPLRVAIEIQRVLKPGGIWVNYSLPMRPPTAPTELGCCTLEELPAFLGATGLETIVSEYERFSFIDLEKISATAPTYLHSVQFFVARKTSDLRHFPGIRGQPRLLRVINDDGWWNAIPKFLPGRTVEIHSVEAITDLCSDRQSQRFEVSFGFVFGTGPWVLGDANIQRLKSVLCLIDGERTFADVYKMIAAQDFESKQTDFRELFHYLIDRLGVIGIQG